MSRPLRVESEGGLYHVLNRGNYRSAIFRSDKTKAAFLKCLGEACEKTGWLIHAWCVMSNHYHLAIETPEANLVEGMRWLQGTFSTRFNRLRRQQGHLFQGRYKSLVVESGAVLGALCHYIHLNPVRARLCSVEQLPQWRWSSASWLFEPKKRPAWSRAEDALEWAGGLRDTPAGRRKYRDYLQWLSEDDSQQKALRFESMSRGWVIGTKGFRKELIKENRKMAALRELGDDEAAEAREAAWQETLQELLGKLGRNRRDLRRDGKFAEWKVAVAAAMKQRSTVTNRWLSENLAMGSLHEVSRQVAAWTRQPDRKLLQQLR